MYSRNYNHVFIRDSYIRHLFLFRNGNILNLKLPTEKYVLAYIEYNEENCLDYMFMLRPLNKENV